MSDQIDFGMYITALKKFEEEKNKLNAQEKVLKQFDNDLLYFSMNNTNDGLQVHINSVNEKSNSFRFRG